MTTAGAVLKALKNVESVDWPVATFVEANSDGTVNLDFGLGPVTCLSAGFHEPLPGDSVRALRTDKGTVMLGPAVPRSVIGLVTATGSPRLTVDTSTGEEQLGYLLSYSPSVSDLVLIFGNIVLGEVSAAPAGSYSPPVPPVTSRQVDFRAVDSGSYSSSWWTADVWCSTNNDGAWFYPDIAGSIDDGATITRVQAYFPEFYADGNPATVGLHSLASKSGAPSISGAHAIAPGAGWRDLPASYGTSLKTGAARGIGVNSDPFGWHKYRSRASDADSGLLRIDWTV